MGVREASAQLKRALKTVPDVNYYEQLSGPVDPPATVLPLPALTWGGRTRAPTNATWVVALVVARSDRALHQLSTLLPSVIEVLDALRTDVVDVAVRDAQPGTYPTGTGDLPAYLINLEVSLL